MDELMNEPNYHHAAMSNGQYFHTNHHHHHHHCHYPAQSQPAHGQHLQSAQLQSHHEQSNHAHPALCDFHFNYASHPFDEFMTDHDECSSNQAMSSLIGIGHLAQPGNTDYEYDDAYGDDDEEEEEEEEEELDQDDEFLSLNMTNLQLQQQLQQQQQSNETEKVQCTRPRHDDEEEKLEPEPETETEPASVYLGTTDECKVRRKNLIIWDWDDTIFPTHSFRTHQDEKDALFMSKLDVLVQCIEKVFQGMIAMYGASNIVIVTNASETWINKCLNVDLVQDIFMNFQQNILKKHAIACISASTREITSKHPKNHHKWKEVAFAQLFEQYFDAESVDDDDENLINCITSIGDSICEYDASHNASKWVKNRILNRVRLKSSPSITEMIQQLKDIAAMMDQFGSTADDMDIDYTSFNTPLSMSLSDTTC